MTTDRSSVITGACLLACLGAGCGSGGGGGGGGAGGTGGSTVPSIGKPIESGFDFQKSSFSFPNFGGYDADAKVTATDLQRMFGATAVCAEGAGSGCRLTPVARDYQERVNDSMSGGRCEGFAVLAGLMHLGLVNPADFGASDPRSLIRANNPKLSEELAYWYSTQYLRDIVKTTTRSLDAAGALDFLATEYSKVDHDMYRLGMVRIDSGGVRAGGHAVLALAVAPGVGPGQYVIKIYDNNHPDTERDILVDRANNTWNYQASSNPDESSSLYTGNSTNGNRLYLSGVRRRTGQQTCEFCVADPNQSDQALNQIFSSGVGEVALHDAGGHTTGEIGGKVYTEIPGSVFTPAFSENTWADRAPAMMVLPAQQNLTIELRPGSSPNQTTSVAMFYPGGSVAVQNAVIPDGGLETLTISDGGRSVSYQPSPGTSPVLVVATTTADGQQVLVRLAIPSNIAVANVSIQIDGGTGNALLKANGRTDVPLVVEVIRSSSRAEHTIDGRVTLPANGSATLAVSSWQGTDHSLPALVDSNGDGQPDQAVTILALPSDDPSNPFHGTVEGATCGTTSMNCGHGHCQERSGVVSCVCDLGFTGAACDACAAGTQDNDGDGTCRTNCASSGLGNCSGHGACSDASGTATCVCAAGYTGATCSTCAAGTQDNDHDGTCQADCASSGLGACSGHGTCSDATGTATCVCAGGYVGSICSSCTVGTQDNDGDGTCQADCASSGLGACSGHGNCSDASGIATCVCAAEYTGATCDVCAAEAQDNDGDGVCRASCASSGLGDCSGHGACSDASGTATCVCAAGYTGATCSTCAAGTQDNDRDGTCKPDCVASGLGDCSGHGVCSAATGTAVCGCAVGYAGPTCSTCAASYQDNDHDGTCQPDCAGSGLGNCSGHGTCSDAGGTAVCVCATGFSGSNCGSCGSGAQDNDGDGECKPDCTSSGLGNCSNHGTCSDASGTATCVCSIGYAGTHCADCATGNQDRDGDGVCLPTCASSDLGNCSNHGTCSDASGTARCACAAGYSGAACDSCAAGYQSHGGPCSPDCATAGLVGCSGHGTCSDATGTASCTCDTGYAGGTCAVCATGYTANPGTGACEVGCGAGSQDNDHNGSCLPTCATAGLVGCGGHGTCDDSGGTATCTCDSGYQDHDGNGACTADCATAGLTGCNGHGTCADATGTAICTCNTGYTGSDCTSCGSGYQDNDSDTTCLATCATAGLVGCNGHGTCSDGSGVAACVCDRAWTGTVCLSAADFAIARGTNGSALLDSTVDSAGNSYVLLQFNGTNIDMGDGVIVSTNGDRDVAVVSYSPTGTARWAAVMGGSGIEEFGHLAVDGSGNVYVVSSTGSGTVHVDNNAAHDLTNPGGERSFVASYDSSGALRWAKILGAGLGMAVTTDSSANVYVGGSLSGSFDFGTGTKTAAGSNVFLVSYDSAGTIRWANLYSSPGWNEWFYDLATDSAGNIFATGEITSSSANLGGTNLSASGTASAVLASYTSAGTHRWSRSFAGTGGYSEGRAVVPDGAGHAVMSVHFNGDIDLGGGALGNAVYSVSALARYSASDGAFGAQQLFTETSGALVMALASDGAGNVYAAGNLNNAGFSLGAGTVASGAFFASYDSAFNFRYGQVADGGAYPAAVGIGLYNGFIYMAGAIDRGYIDWGSGRQYFLGTGGNQLWIARVAPVPVLSGLAGRWNGRDTGAITRDISSNISLWRDTSGNGRALTVAGSAPRLQASLINGAYGVSFAGGAGLVSSAFPLTSEVTVFAVIQYQSPASAGLLACHGSKDTDWSIEQNSAQASTVMHFQSDNDSTGGDLTFVIGKPYLLVGRISGSTREFTQIAADGSNTVTASGVSISPASVPFYLGRSNTGEASNQYVGELLYYNRALSNAERDQVVQFLQGEWNLGAP